MKITIYSRERRQDKKLWTVKYNKPTKVYAYKIRRCGIVNYGSRLNNARDGSHHSVESKECSVSEYGVIWEDKEDRSEENDYTRKR